MLTLYDKHCRHFFYFFVNLFFILFFLFFLSNYVYISLVQFTLVRYLLVGNALGQRGAHKGTSGATSPDTNMHSFNQGSVDWVKVSNKQFSHRHIDI